MRRSAWVYFFLPEVKDRTLEEIDEMVCTELLDPKKWMLANSEQFEAQLPAKKFRKYKCAGRVVGSDLEKKEAVMHAEEVTWADGRVAAEAATVVV